jgi:hypothetical protein
MKFDKWTVALATVGVVSLASAARANEKPSPVMTALSSTTISGYVDTSAQWNFGTGNASLPPYKFGGASKADGFNLNVVQLRLEKSLASDTDQWATGYRVDLWAGPDANVLNTQSILAGANADSAIRQAYVQLRTPVGNGLDWKVGVFDSILGYESVESPSNPNFTRSYGHSIEPQSHTGVLAGYRFSDTFVMQAGIADTFGPTINERAQGPNFAGSGAVKPESYKTYMVSAAVTAPDSMAFLSGSTLYAGIVNGFSDHAASVLDNTGTASNNNGDVTSWYVGSTIATPVEGLRLGAAFDYLDIYGDNVRGQTWTLGGYASFQATEKLSLHGRLEFLKDSAGFFQDGLGNPTVPQRAMDLTGTIQYDLWKNVLSRLELRWDHSLTGAGVWGGTIPSTAFGTPTGTQKNAWLLAANVVYKF